MNEFTARSGASPLDLAMSRFIPRESSEDETIDGVLENATTYIVERIRRIRSLNLEFTTAYELDCTQAMADWLGRIWGCQAGILEKLELKPDSRVKGMFPLEASFFTHAPKLSTLSLKNIILKGISEMAVAESLILVDITYTPGFSDPPTLTTILDFLARTPNIETLTVKAGGFPLPRSGRVPETSIKLPNCRHLHIQLTSPNTHETSNASPSQLLSKLGCPNLQTVKLEASSSGSQKLFSYCEKLPPYIQNLALPCKTLQLEQGLCLAASYYLENNVNKDSSPICSFEIVTKAGHSLDPDMGDDPHPIIASAIKSLPAAHPTTLSERTGLGCRRASFCRLLEISIRPISIR